MRKTLKSKFYPKPHATGGKLIRAVIAALKTTEFYQSPSSKTSDILIATSGGPDSLALAHLLVHYGRRVGDPARITLLHINHGWRGKASDQDELFVKKLAKKWGVQFKSTRVPLAKKGESPEEAARRERAQVFKDQIMINPNTWIFTAHHADDQAETVLWRILTGTFQVEGQGILTQSGRVLRPLLEVRKQDLIDYLSEERLTYRIDKTNQSLKYLRNRIRLKLMPEVEALFPRAVQHLSQLSRVSRASNPPQNTKFKSTALQKYFLKSGVKLRRSHWESLENLAKNAESIRGVSSGSVDLPEGWRLSWKLAKIPRVPSSHNS